MKTQGWLKTDEGSDAHQMERNVIRIITIFNDFCGYTGVAALTTMPVRDRLASLKKTVVKDGDVMVMSSLINTTIEEENTDEFLTRASELREAITEMNGAVELIRQLHNLLKVSTQHQDRARLRLLFDELSRVFKQFSEDLDRVVAAVNCMSDEVRDMKDQTSAFYRMRKDQTESLRSTLLSVVLRFRNEEVPFEQDTKPATEKQLREFQMKPSAVFKTQQVQNNADAESTPSLVCTEVDEERSEHDEKAVLMEVKQRNEDLLLLEKAVSTLNSLHEHLNFLVHADNPMIDRIDANISQAVEYTTKVMNDTNEAVKLNQEAKEKSVLVLFLAAVIIFLVIMMLFTFVRVWITGR
ncbi:unnamed protein product [Heligmosomoides polygyrus]|uniref:t-SNARE coiled-coil homology domain-containing protein n=1 Tax=Heligmosomoides polygyrus TaxID=6339 RepID=A0A183G9G9_HELPZ|nr:unnamed protein product [Heligmosomoides polygyrus]